MSSPRTRVLVVDDSAFARKMIRDTLSADPRFEVVGFARDGLEALERIAELKPDVVTLDLFMPNLDGVGVLAALPAEGAPRVVVVSMADEDSEVAITALQMGAVDLLQKPTALATEQLYELAGDLVAKVAAAAEARTSKGPRRPPAPLPSPVRVTGRKLLLIGASTGGPQAITYLLKQLPGSLSVPVAIVVHMPTGYTAAFAERLNEESALEVVEASDDLVLRPGLVVIARAGLHLKIESKGGHLRTRLDVQPVESAHTPSVDALFSSAAPFADEVVAVVLTGMGNDGTAGARALHDAGAAVITQDESSCVVFGMPRAVIEAGLSDETASLEDLAAAIYRYL